MGRGGRASQGRADRARGRSVRDHDRGQPDRHGDRPALDETEPRRMIATQTLEPARAPLGSTPIPRNHAPPDLRARPSWRTAKNSLMLGLMAAALVAVAI